MSNDDGGLTPELLQAAEEQLGMTQAEMAAAAGVSARAYRDWRNGKHAPRPSKRGPLIRFLRDRGVITSHVDVAIDAPRVSGVRLAALAALAHVPDELLLDAIRALNDIAEHGAEGGRDPG